MTGEPLPALQAASPSAPPAAPAAFDRRRIEGLAARYRLVLPEHHRSVLQGDLSGRRAGSSIEYQDRKDYVPGDDLRHIDWRAFARSDRLTVKLYREEITPRVDIVADASLSMAVTEGKARRRTEIVHFLLLLARRLHAVVRLHRLDDRIGPLEDPLALLSAGGRPQENPMPLLAAAPFARQGGVKILVSDFLFPFPPADLVSLFPRADRLVCVQVLADYEDDPRAAGELRLEEAETGDHLDVALNAGTIAGYRKRLEALRGELDRRLRLAGGALAVLRDDQTLDDAVRRLFEAGIITA